MFDTSKSTFLASYNNIYYFAYSCIINIFTLYYYCFIGTKKIYLHINFIIILLCFLPLLLFSYLFIEQVFDIPLEGEKGTPPPTQNHVPPPRKNKRTFMSYMSTSCHSPSFASSPKVWYNKHTLILQQKGDKHYGSK